MNNYISLIFKNIYSILGLSFTIFFGIVSMYFYYKSKAQKSVLILFDDIELQTKTHPDIEISYKGEKIDNLFKMQILFFNNGEKEIRREDIPHKGGLVLSFNNVHVLSTTIRETSQPANNIKLIPINENQYKISFEYLNPNDGGLFEIFYDENLNEEDEDESNIFDVIGAIIGVKNITIKHYSKYISELRSLSDFIVYIIGALIVYTPTYLLFKSNHYYWGTFFVFLSSSVTFSIIKQIYRIFGNKTPKFTNKYFE